MIIKKTIPYIIFFVIPFICVIVGIFSGYFGIEFTKEVLHCFGQISLWLLILMLIARYFTKIPLLALLNKYKKAIGISSFLFALLHVILYILSISISNLIPEIIQRRYILLGFLLFILMLCMFVYSFVQHKIFVKISPLILPFSLLGALHYLFSTKIIDIKALIAFFIILVLISIQSIKKA